MANIFVVYINFLSNLNFKHQNTCNLKIIIILYIFTLNILCIYFRLNYISHLPIHYIILNSNMFFGYAITLFHILKTIISNILFNLKLSRMKFVII